MTFNKQPPPLKPIYPDVIRQITGGPRINMEKLEVAVGISPQIAYLNQPIELVVVLQNMMDKEMQVKIALRTPTTDPQGDVVVVEVAKPQIGLALGPGEVGVLYMPLIARPPTKATKEVPVRVAIRYRVPEGEQVRPPGGGASATVLSVSEFKMQVLREVSFIAHKWNESTDILTVNFGVAPKSLPVESGQIKPRYDTLWKQEVLTKQIALIKEKYKEALAMARPAATGSLYPAMIDAVEERFTAREMILHPGETMAIAKMMCYTIEDAPTREPDVQLENTRWFRALCQLLAAQPDLVNEDRNQVISKMIFEAVLYEAILMGFTILESKVNEDLGDKDERLNYANRFMRWFSGHGEADLTYVYLPLVLGGLGIARLVRSGMYENPWDIFDQLTEAINGRMNLLSSENVIIFDMMDTLLESYARTLRARRIPRPEDDVVDARVFKQDHEDDAAAHADNEDDEENERGNIMPGRRRNRMSGREL